MEPWVLTLALTQNTNPLSPSLGLSFYHRSPKFWHLHTDVAIYAIPASIFITQYFLQICSSFFLITFMKPGFDVLLTCSILIKIITQINYVHSFSIIVPLQYQSLKPL